MRQKDKDEGKNETKKIAKQKREKTKVDNVFVVEIFHL